jgi:ABC-type branched-subunit amino acid transport system substrate-binding protein
MRDARIPGSFDFGYRFREHYGVYPSFNSAGGYAAGQILEAAVRLTGTTDHAAVREQLRNLKFRSILGHYRVDESGQQVGKPIYVIQWQDGHRSLVLPEELARWEARYPYPSWDSR